MPTLLVLILFLILLVLGALSQQQQAGRQAVEEVYSPYQSNSIFSTRNGWLAGCVSLLLLPQSLPSRGLSLRE